MKKILLPNWLIENLKKHRFKKDKSVVTINNYGLIKNGKLKLINIKK